MSINDFMKAKGGAISAALAVRLDSAVSGRFFHAAIISGGSEAQRELVSEALSAAAVCLAQSGRPCMSCAGCRKAEEGIHPDILHLRVPDGKSTIPVNSVRDSLRELALKPGEAPRRALVIHSAELLGVPGQNVLLATLEEPPGDVLFLLLAENERALLETVRSRCAILRLGAAEQKGGDELPNQAREILSAYRALINSRGTRGRAEGRCELLAAVYRLNKLKGSQIIEIASALRRECVREMVEAERLGRDARAFAGMERAAAEAIELAGSNVNAGHIGGRLTAALIEAADRFS